MTFLHMYIIIYGHTQLARGPRFILSTEELTLNTVCIERDSFSVAAKNKPSTETVRLIRDGGRGGGGMEVGGEGDYIPIATLSPPE